MAEHQSMDPRGAIPLAFRRGPGPGVSSIAECTAQQLQWRGCMDLTTVYGPTLQFGYHDNPLDVVDLVDDCDEREQAD